MFPGSNRFHSRKCGRPPPLCGLEELRFAQGGGGGFHVGEQGRSPQEGIYAGYPGGLFTDLLVAVTRGEEATSGNVASSEDTYSMMRVSALHQKCHENGLNVDGSREMLIAALKERISEV